MARGRHQPRGLSARDREAQRPADAQTGDASSEHRGPRPARGHADAQLAAAHSAQAQAGRSGGGLRWPDRAGVVGRGQVIELQDSAIAS
jgi:hypothetical protein